MSDVEVMASLGEVANEPIEQTGPPTNGSFVYVDIGSLDKEAKTIGDAKEIAVEAAPSRAKQRLCEGDVLVSMTRPNLNAVAIVPSQLDGAIGSTGFHVLRTRWMEPGFLYYLVQTSGFVDAMTSVVQGALYPAVRPADINKFQFLLPPRAEQTRIVAKLESLLSDLDAGVAELKAAQKKLAQYRQSLLKAAVEGALTAEWRTSNTPSETGAQLLERILTERRTRWEAKQRAKFAEQGKTPPKDWQKKYPEPVKPDTSDLPELPEGWVWATIDQCSLDENGITDGPFGSNLKTEHYTESGPRVIRLQNIGDGEFLDARAHISEAHYEQLQKHAVCEGDLVVAMLGETLPRACIVPRGIAPAIVKADCARIRLNTELVPSEFLTAALNAEPTRKRVISLVKGIGRPRVNLVSIRSIAIPIPPLAEQYQILTQLDTALTACQQQQNTIAHALKQSTAQRQNILRAAFAGELVPQDPNDEPASVLLERIRAEHEAVRKPRGRKAKETA